MDYGPLIYVIVALIGAAGGIAALLKVQSDNSNSVASGAKAVSEGAKTVIELMDERIQETERRADVNSGRISVLEEYVAHFDVWADKLLSILDRAIALLPEVTRPQFEAEVKTVKADRPKRDGSGSKRTTTRTVTLEQVDQTVVPPAS